MEPWVTGGSLRSGRGFTLVELLLVLVLMFLLLGAVVFSFSTAQTSAQLTEGATQLEALLHFARAQAAFTGKRVELRLVLSSPGAEAATSSSGGLLARRLEVRWEPDPVQQPGLFQKLEEASAFLSSMHDLVEVTEIRPLPGTPSGSSGSEEVASVSTNALANTIDRNGAAEDLDPDFLAITLFPDGSSDSGEFGLRVPDSEDGRVMWISLDGITGSIRRRMEIPEDLGRAGDHDLDGAARPELVVKLPKK